MADGQSSGLKANRNIYFKIAPGFTFFFMYAVKAMKL
jgi:hypothetical protein